MSTGSLPELQFQYCNSYFVEIALLSSALDNNHADTLEVFASARLPAKVYESLPYHFKLQVPFQSDDRLEQLSCMFDLLEANKRKLNIKFYSISQMSLEQIFVSNPAHTSTRFSIPTHRTFTFMPPRSTSRGDSSKRECRLFWWKLEVELTKALLCALRYFQQLQ